jgi:predicted RNA-binding protein with PIN domain
MKWLIDGHNLIGQMPNLGLSDPDDEEKLLEHLRRFRARTGHHLTVIFDAGLAYRPGEKRKRGGITVQFAAHGQTADRILIRQVQQVKNPQEVTVVSSDRMIQQAARAAQVRVVSSQEFARQLLQPSSAATTDEEGDQTDIKLSPEEVEAWLALFKQRKA